MAGLLRFSPRQFLDWHPLWETLDPPLLTLQFLQEKATTQGLQGKIANLECMVSIHCTFSLDHVIKMRASWFDTNFISPKKLTTFPLIHSFVFNFKVHSSFPVLHKVGNVGTFVQLLMIIKWKSVTIESSLI